jgi:hypothetical protein
MTKPKSKPDLEAQIADVVGDTVGPLSQEQIDAILVLDPSRGERLLLPEEEDTSTPVELTEPADAVIDPSKIDLSGTGPAQVEDPNASESNHNRPTHTF